MILVACGWPADAELVCRALAGLGGGGRVIEGAGGLRTSLAGGRPDLVIADASAGAGPPGALLEALDAAPHADELPVVLLADVADAPLLAGVLARRFHATLLTKPVTHAQFEAAVRAGLAYGAGRREHRRLLAELEGRVARRTAELERANAALRAEAAERRRVEAERTELRLRLDEAQEDERRRVARELHDGVGQEVTALILGLKALEQAGSEDAVAGDGLRAVSKTAGWIARKLHDLAVEVRPTALDDLGLGAALSAYVARWSERTGLAADFQCPGLGGDRLPPEVETAIYRLVQEALNNVAQHAAARRVSVIVTRRPDEATALVEDDGRGFNPVQTEAGPHHRRRLGLLGMKERVSLVGGTLVTESGDGAGTSVQARIPLGAPAMDRATSPQA